MIYLTRDGALFGGTTAEQCVAELRKLVRWDSNGVDLDDAKWTAIVAERARLQTGREVRADSAELFLDDLVGAGLIERPATH